MWGTVRNDIWNTDFQAPPFSWNGKKRENKNTSEPKMAQAWNEEEYLLRTLVIR